MLTVAPPHARLRPVRTGAQGLDEQPAADMSRQAELHDVLRRFQSDVDGARGTVLATRDGLPIAATIAGATLDTVAAMAATVIALADQAVPCDGPDEGTTVIRGTEGCLVVRAAGPTGVLAVQTGAHPNLGLIHVEAPAVAASLAAALGASC